MYFAAITHPGPEHCTVIKQKSIYSFSIQEHQDSLKHPWGDPGEDPQCL